MRTITALAVFVTVANSTVAAGDAQTVRPLRAAVRPLPGRTAAARPEHVVFGRIELLGRTTFVLRLRSGRRLPVDASVAIASGRFSSPLFVGKVVVLTGTIRPNGIFDATTVTRLLRLDETTRPDR